jgi:protein TonB
MAAALALGLVACGDHQQPPKKMQTVKLLPDTPPPPPPPKPEEKKPEAPKDDKPLPQPPKPAEAPVQAQALKSDEAAGNGPGGGLVAGVVTQDYSNQQIGGASIGGSGSGDGAASLAVANAFASALTRSINDHLARDRDLRRSDYRARVLVWLTPQGSLQRVELAEGTGDVQTDQALREALGRFPGATLPPPERLPQPLRLLVTNRMIG